MSKQYFCKKGFDGMICGETKIENFEKGRYSICKKCKNRQCVEIQKSKRLKNLELETINTVKEAKDIAKNVILKVPLLNGETIIKNFEDIN